MGDNHCSLTICGEDMESWLSTQTLEIGQLVWVCKSKGIKNKKKTKEARDNQPTESPLASDRQPDTSKYYQQDNQPQQQRLELFLRARIHALDECCNGNIDELSGRVAGTCGGGPSSCHCRLTVIYPKGSTYRVRRSHLWPILDPSISLSSLSKYLRQGGDAAPHQYNNQLNTRTLRDYSKIVLVWPETNEYRRCCVQHTVLLPGKDFFVEVGCDYGKTVAKVANTITSATATTESIVDCVLGIDKSTESITVAKQRYPNLLFLQWDILLPQEEAHHKDCLQPLEEMLLKQWKGGEDALKDMSCSDSDEVSTSLLPPHPPRIVQYLVERYDQLRTGTMSAQCSRIDDFVEGDESSAFHSSSLVVAIDINGNRELEAVQSCLSQVQALWQPRLIIVKSRALHQKIKPTKYRSAD
ncbi:hypothetical protein ACA910_005337 [Epithemia clementina (nom. ined.)]